MEDFGNGRFVDKVIDLTISSRAKRTNAQKYYNDITEKEISGDKGYHQDFFKRTIAVDG